VYLCTEWSRSEWDRVDEVRRWTDVPLQRHLDILCLPVDLQVIILQPVVSQDQALLPKTCDSQLCML
jgi:hypothetical protein